MVKTIGNPLSWAAQIVGGTAEHVTETVEQIGGQDASGEIVIRDMNHADIRYALKKGIEDFAAARADVLFLCVFYPLTGLLLIGFGFQLEMLPLLFPLATGFALIAPLAAVGLYEISRRRERGEKVNWGAALRVAASPNFGAIVVLGGCLLVVFVGWLLAADLIYTITLGPVPPVSATAFVTDVFTTSAGWAMVVLGVGVGFAFSLVVLAMSVVSFPLLLDRKVGVPTAIVTSIQVSLRNPGVIITWGFIVAAGLLLGAIPLLIGLVIVLPVLGHATWHLYRRAIERA